MPRARAALLSLLVPGASALALATPTRPSASPVYSSERPNIQISGSGLRASAAGAPREVDETARSSTSSEAGCRPAVRVSIGGSRRAAFSSLLDLAAPAALAASLSRRLEDRRVRDGLVVEKATSLLRTLTGRDAELKETPMRIESRLKTAKSVEDKLVRKQDAFLDDLRDIVGVRVVVGAAGEEGTRLCYKVLRELANSPTVLGVADVKDYVRAPKANGYQSLHATVYPVDRCLPRYEIQVRTSEMDRVASHGSAAHEKYKARP